MEYLSNQVTLIEIETRKSNMQQFRDGVYNKVIKSGMGPQSDGQPQKHQPMASPSRHGEGGKEWPPARCLDSIGQ